MSVRLRVELVESDNTAVMCVACGRFRSEYVIVRNDGTPGEAGLHAKCLDDVRARNGKKNSGLLSEAQAEGDGTGTRETLVPTTMGHSSTGQNSGL